MSGKAKRSHFRTVAFPARVPGKFGFEDMVNPLLDFVQLGLAFGIPDFVAQFVERLQHAFGSAAGSGEAPRRDKDRDQRSQKQRGVIELVVVLIEETLLAAVVIGRSSRMDRDQSTSIRARRSRLRQNWKL